MPTKMSRDEELVFYHSVGRLIDRWGYIDSLVTQLCKDLNEHLGHALGKRAPWGLTDRLDFVAMCFKTDHRLQELDAVLAGILTAVRQIDNHRSYLVHGCKTDFYREPLAVQLTKLDRIATKDGYEQFSTRLTFAELGHLGDAASAVVAGLVDVSKKLAERAC